MDNHTISEMIFAVSVLLLDILVIRCYFKFKNDIYEANYNLEFLNSRVIELEKDLEYYKIKARNLETEVFSKNGRIHINTRLRKQVRVKQTNSLQKT